MPTMVTHFPMRLKLPHIPRIITASIIPSVGTMLLWGILISLIAYNVVLWRTKPLSFAPNVFAVFVSPFSMIPHKNLGLALWDAGAREDAKREILLAIELRAPTSQAPADSQVLGTTTDPEDLLQIWENSPRMEAAAFKFWQQVTISHPDYRDAYIQLALVSYNQGNLTATKTYLAAAAALDPNGKAVHDLLEFINKKLER